MRTVSLGRIPWPFSLSTSSILHWKESVLGMFMLVSMTSNSVTFCMGTSFNSLSFLKICPPCGSVSAVVVCRRSLNLFAFHLNTDLQDCNVRVRVFHITNGTELY